MQNWVGGSDVNEFGNFSKEPEISVFTTEPAFLDF